MNTPAWPPPEGATLHEVRAGYMAHVMRRHGGNATAAARSLGMNVSGFCKGLRRMGLGHLLRPAGFPEWTHRRGAAPAPGEIAARAAAIRASRMEGGAA